MKNALWILVADGTQVLTSPEEVAAPEPGFVRAFQPETKEIRSIAIPFYGHEVVAHPLQKHLAVSFLRWGHFGVLVDFLSQKTIMSIKSPKGTRFFGHAQWSPEGDKLFCTAHNDLEKKGQVLTYRFSNGFHLDAVQDSGGDNPHQLALSDDGKQLSVVNFRSGTGSSFVQIDLVKNCMNKKIVCQRPGFAHLAWDSQQNDFWIGGVLNRRYDQEALFSVVNNSEQELKLQSLGQKPVIGELLSLAISPGDRPILAVTVPQSNHVGLYDLYSRKFLIEIKTQSRPRGVTFAKVESDQLYINCENGDCINFEISRHSPGTINVKQRSITNLGNGSHLNLTSIAV